MNLKKLIRKYIVRFLGLGLFCFAMAMFPFNSLITDVKLKGKALSDVTLSDCVITDIAAGTDHNLALDQNGNLWVWGKNDHGQLGDGTKINCNKPKRIMVGHKFSKISAGNDCSAAIDVDGRLYGWGSSINPSKIETSTPTLVDESNKYSDVHCSYDSTQVSSIGNSDIFFGYAYYYYYDGHTRETWKPVELRSTSNGDDCHPKKTNSTSYRAYSKENNYSSSSLTDYQLADAIKAIDGVYFEYYNCGVYIYSAFYDYTFIIDSNGKLDTRSRGCKGYASNSDGKNTIHQFFPADMNLEALDDFTLTDVSVRKVMDSSSNCNCTAYFVTDAGAIYSVGDNKFGLLGNSNNGTADYVSNPVLVSSECDFDHVSAGANHVLALDHNGKVYAWGSNQYGQLGTGDNLESNVPEKIMTFDESKTFDVIAFANENINGSFAQLGGNSYAVVEKPNKGTLSIQENGDFEYVPSDNQFGWDDAIISIEFSGMEIKYNVNIYIDRKPLFVGGTSSFNVECGQSFTGTAPATDPDGDNLAYSIFQAPAKGNVILNDNAGSYTYTAGMDMAGGDSFIIVVSDGYCSVQYPVSVHVQSLISYSDNTDILIDLLSTDSYSGNVNAVDIDGDTLSYSIKKNGSKGTAKIDSLGNYTYTIAGNSYGQDSFVVKVDDGYKPLEITYNVTLFSVSDGGTVLAKKISPGAVYNGEIKTDAFGVIPEYTISSQPSNGNVILDSKTGKYTYTPNIGSSGDDSFVVLVDYSFGQYTITIHVYQNSIPNNALVVKEFTTPENNNYNGTVQCTDSDGDLLTYSVKTQPKKGSISLNPTTGDYIYYPNSDVAGNDSFEINVSDGTDSITNLIQVHIESEITVASEINRTISQNTSLSANVEASDKDGDILIYSISKNAENGIANVDSLTGDFIYIPNTNYYGNDSFNIKVDDGNSPKTVTVNVLVNRRPIADAVSIYLKTQGVTVTGTASCSDPDGDALIYSLVNQPSQGNVIVNSTNGAFAYTPKADAHGNDSFQIEATDGCDDVLVNVIVHNETDVNLERQETTIVVNQGKSTTGQILATDLDGDELIYSILGYPTQGTINLNSSTGTWTYNAKSTANGRDSFKVQVTDGNSTAELEYSLIINTPAVFEKDSYSFVTNQNNNYTGSVHAIDLDGDSLVYSIVSQGSKGMATIDPLTGRYQYAPTLGEAGDDSFIVGVSDGSFTTEVEVKVHIESDVVVSSGTLTFEVEQNEIVTGNVNASDADGDVLTFSIFKQGDKGNANVMGDGSFSYFANSGAGDDSFVISVTDGIHVSYVAVYVHISSEPYFEESGLTISVPQSGSVSGKVHGVDPDGDSLTYAVSKQPTAGFVNLNSQTGEYTYTAFSNSKASKDSFEVSVTDGVTISYVTVTVLINNAPEVEDCSITVSQGGNGTGKVSANDLENDQLTYSISAQGKYGSASINSFTGEYTYVVTDKSFSGTDSFTVSVTDGYSVKTIVVSVDVVKNQRPSSSGTTIEVSSGESVKGILDVSDPENDSLTYAISYQGDKGTAFIDEDTGKFTYVAKQDTMGNDCFVVSVSDGYNTVSYLVEVEISYVDSNNSWAIPTTIATSSVSAISIGSLVFIVLKKRKKAKR